MKKKILLIIVALLVVIQFIRPTRNISTGNSPNDISLHYQVPDTIQQILKVACNDCHSNNTVYPWYTNIQPVGWWMQHHVNEGKNDLNFSEFATYEPTKAARKMKQIADRVHEKDMPLNSYTWIHKNSILSDTQIKMMVDWSDSLREMIKQKNNLPPSDRY